MSDPPKIAIIVVNYNSVAFIDEFCESLKAITYPAWSLIAIDSGSTDGSLSRIEAAFPTEHCGRERVIRCEDNIGFAAGANLPIEQGLVDGCTFVLFLNDDTVVTPQFLDRMAAAADERTVVVPKILYHDDPRLLSTHAGGFDWHRGVFRNTFHGRADSPAANVRRDDLDTASFCCALVPVQAFRDAGLLDTRFFMYYEETDWLRRAQQLGYRVRYEPSAVIYHRESGSSGGGWMTPFKQYYATRNRLYLMRKHARSARDHAAFTAYFWATRPGVAASMAAARQWRLLRAMVLGMFDYYRGRMGRTRQVRDL